MTTLRASHFKNIRGKIKEQAALAKNSWFKVGGPADILFKPQDEQDMICFLKQLPADCPILPLGALSNVIIRDKGFRGVVIKFSQEFTRIEIEGLMIKAGAGALDMNVAKAAYEAGISGLEFLMGIPGTVGGGLKMNAGAHGAEFKDIVVEAYGLTHQGIKKTLNIKDLNFSYRHSDVSDHLILTGALLKGAKFEDKAIIKARLDEVKSQREKTQPIHEQTGGSTFANPSKEDCDKVGLPIMKSWQLIEGVQGDNIKVGGAQMSKMHKNFMINDGSATASDLENLGEEIRQKVHHKYGIMLRWEIKRLGEK